MIEKTVKNTALGEEFLKGVAAKGTQQLRNLSFRNSLVLPLAVIGTLAILDRVMNHFAALGGKTAAVGLSDDFNKVSPSLDGKATQLVRRKGEIKYNLDRGEFTLDPKQVRLQQLSSGNN